jgi:hypothetical protein
MRKKISGLNYLMNKVVLGIQIIVVTFMLTSTANAEQQSKICTDIRKVLIQSQQGHEPKDFFIELHEKNGLDIYQELDIDNDKIADSVAMSCAGSSNSGCFLTVNLSSGKRLEFEENRFFLARIKSSLYVIVGETSEKEKDKRGKRKVYQITKNTVKLICSHI